MMSEVLAAETGADALELAANNEAAVGEQAEMNLEQMVSRAEYEQALAELQDWQRLALEREVESEIERLLTEAGAKNHRAVRSLLGIDELLAAKELPEGWQEGLREQVNGLCEAPETAFLFDLAPGGMRGWVGFVPAAAGDEEYQGDEGGFRLRLAQAQGNQDSLAAIRVKQEAAGRGVFL